MVSQLSLVGAEYFNEPEPVKVEENTRIRYEVPTYIKFYSIYQYDREKFTKLLKIWLETDEGKNRTLETLKAKQDEILELCYVRDNEGNLLNDSDEEHIFRYNVLNYEPKYSSNGIKIIKYKDKNGIVHYKRLYDKPGIYELIYNMLEKDAFAKSEKIEKWGLNIYPNDRQAEIAGTWNMPIKQRVKIHIRLLRLLRKGLSIKEALCKIKG